MPALCVVDTMVLRKANAPLENDPREGRAFVKRLALLQSIRSGERQVLMSAALLAEYRQQVLSPRNELIQTFFSLLDDKKRCRMNWPPWPGRHRETQAKCQFPAEDTHVLRTAFVADGEKKSTIFSEEGRMLKTDACIHRHFGVHVSDPTA